MTEEDPDDVALLKDMAKEARQYLQSHDWCPPIRKLSLGYGVAQYDGDETPESLLARADRALLVAKAALT